eukprot:TRINITY_DN1004_c6_g1_i1.p1 TRINITY_DN1004_c6_g1~~TRINITY_DN1004_c6_g1_i1.p1  ORF type:complete len:176 (+),score=33.30 TRINITY_DN1004_c6_g1_i1:67-528(+)
MCGSDSVSRTSHICCHNNYDNIRVNKVTKHLVLRCRDCGDQIKGSSSLIWNTLRCQEFTKNGSCSNGGDCTSLHIHYKKQKKEDRIVNAKHCISLVIDEEIWAQSVHSQSTVASVSSAPSTPSSITTVASSSVPSIGAYRHDPYGVSQTKVYC